MADIFLSYARADQALAEPIKARLEALGLTVFFDIDGGVDAGDAFPQRIADAVMSSKVTLACWTPLALTRPWCRRECFMARELHKLVPVALSPLTPSDLKEFIDASYESLIDFDGQEKHFGWSQTLGAIARKLDAWVSENPEDPSAGATLDQANALRKTSLETRPTSAPRDVKGLTGASAIWESLQSSTDPDDLLRFAETFVGTPEGLEARRRAAHLNAEAAAFNQLHPNDSFAIDRFLIDWPEHPRRAEAIAMRDALATRNARQAQEEARERRKEEARERRSREIEKGEQRGRAIATFGPWVLGAGIAGLALLGAPRDGFLIYTGMALVGLGFLAFGIQHVLSGWGVYGGARVVWVAASGLLLLSEIFILVALPSQTSSVALEAPAATEASADSQQQGLAERLGLPDTETAYEGPPLNQGIYVQRDVCPFEGCVYGRWRANVETLIRREPNDASAVVGVVGNGEEVQAQSGEVHIVPVRGVVVRSLGEFRVGDPVYRLSYRGEGVWDVWHNGRVADTFNSDYWSRENPVFDFGVPDGPQNSWWVVILRSNGDTGWSRETDHFDGKDQFG